MLVWRISTILLSLLASHPFSLPSSCDYSSQLLPLLYPTTTTTMATTTGSAICLLLSRRMRTLACQATGIRPNAMNYGYSVTSYNSVRWRQVAIGWGGKGKKLTKKKDVGFTVRLPLLLLSSPHKSIH